MQRFYFEVFADYFTILLFDEGAEYTPDYWNDSTLADWIAVRGGFIAIETARNMPVPLIVEIQSVSEEFSKTGQVLDTWDHAVECSVEIRSGKIVVLGMDYLPDAPRINISPGVYHVTILYGGLTTLSENGLEGNDVYWVILSPGQMRPTRVVKRFARH